MNLRDDSLQVYDKSSFTHPLSCILPSFSQNKSRLLLPKTLWSVRLQFLSVESSITCNLPVQSRFIQINYLHVKYSIWRSLERSFCQINWKPVFLVIPVDSWNYMPPILVPSSAKRIATQMLVTEKINGRKYFVLRGFVWDIIRPSKKLPVQS